MSRIRKPLIGDVSTANSTTNPLGIGAEFLGTSEDITDVAIIFVSLATDQPGLLSLEQSPDNVNWDHDDEFDVIAGEAKTFSLNPAVQYFRVHYTNNGVAQTYFRLQTIFKAAYCKPSSHNIGDPIVIDDDAELVKSVFTGQSSIDGIFRNVNVTPRNNMTVSLDEFGDSTAVDAFGRLRISNPANIYENMLQYDLQPLKNDISLTGTGTVTHLPDQSAAELSTGGTASGAKAIFQSRKYHRYQAGKSLQVLMTACLGAPKANVRQRIGLFDDDNGIFFEQVETAKRVVIRSSTSGSPVETVVDQADWNLDKLDGTGLSKITIDWSKAQIFLMDFQWLGVGRVRLGFDINGSIVYCHEFNHANIETTVYMTTPHLPTRTSIENTGVAASTTTLIKFCSAVVAEGGAPEEPGNPFAVGRGVTPLGVTTRRPILSIRPSPTFQSIVNRGHVTFNQLEVLATTNNCLWELVKGGTLTGASWGTVDATNSIVDYDTAATAITGGVVIDRGWSIAGLGATSGVGQQNALPVEIFNDFAGTTPESLSIVCTAFTGTSNVNSLIRWLEQR